MIKKQGQVTIFLIIGIVSLSIMLLFFYMQNIERGGSKSQAEVSVIISQDKQTTKNYVESCLASIAEPLIIEFAKKGGSFIPSDIVHEEISINVLAQYKSDFGYQNLMLTKEEMEKELNDNIKEQLKSCINKEVFEKQGFVVIEGDSQVDTTIGIDNIHIFLKKPMTLKKSDYTINLDDYSIILKLPLGNLYAVAIDIVNKESFQGYFDKEDYILNHDIMIEKFKPYPHTIYRIKQFIPQKNKDFVFQFALRGKDTVGKETIVYSQKGCCKVQRDALCYKNVDKEQCNGEYIDNTQCGCEDNFQFSVEGCCKTNFGCKSTTKQECTGQFNQGDISCSQTSCKNLECKKTYNYENDDFSGFTKSNGESWCVYESITGRGRDFVGTQHYLHSCINGKEYTEPCRDFREEICVEDVLSGKTKAKCRTNRWYDCANQNDQASCEDTSLRDCYWTDYLVSQKKCNPYISPGLKFWKNEGNKVCNAANLNKDEDGIRFPNSWGHGVALHCLRVGDCGNSRNTADDITEFGYYNPDIIVEQWVYGNPAYNRKGNEYILNLPFDVDTEISTSIAFGTGSAHAVCNLWQSGADRCDYCDSSKLHSCTEYKCQSLGRGCVFRKGDKSCVSSGTTDRIPPVIKDFTLEEYIYTKKPNSYYAGSVEYEVNQPIPIHQPLSFSFSTSEPTRCVASIFPPYISQFTIETIKSLGSATPEIQLNEYEYKTQYSSTVRLPSSSFTKITNYLLFLRCTDRYGNTNDKENIINVRTKEDEVDILNPELIKIQAFLNNLIKGTTNDIIVFINEPFMSCRYAESDILHDFMKDLNCSTEEENILYQPGYPFGSFACRTSINISINANNLFFSCEDWSGNKNKVSYSIDLGRII
jgi:hypothetical protein